MSTATWQQTESDAHTMPLYVSVPESSGPFPGLVVIQHQTGIDEFLQAVVQRLAGAGYVAAAPNLYHRDAPECQDDPRSRSQRLGDRRVMTDVEATVSYLQRHGAVDGKRIGVIGFCMGGRVAYLVAATNPAFKAAVTFYPGNTGRAWGRDIPTPFERSANIHCPIQGHFGDDDKNPSPEDRQNIAAELAKHKKTHEFYAYSGAGHAFMDNTKESFRADAEVVAWPRTLEFLRRHLGP